MGQVKERKWTPEGWQSSSTSTKVTREELDAQAETLGLDPKSYGTKAEIEKAVADEQKVRAQG